MMCTTVLHGGVCHCTSTPHKSGNNMKKKKEKKIQVLPKTMGGWVGGYARSKVNIVKSGWGVSNVPKKALRNT